MRRILLALVLALPALLVGRQDPPPPPAPEPPPLLEPGARGAATMQQLEGAWTLQEIAGSRVPLEPGEVNGFALIVDGYIAMVLHARELERGLLEVARQRLRVQGTLRQFEVRDTGSMLSASIIGHSTFGGEDIALEPVNAPSSYVVEVIGDTLFITRDDNSKLVFRRMRPGMFPRAAEERLREIEGARKWEGR